jgi:hypothetical protein
VADLKKEEEAVSLTVNKKSSTSPVMTSQADMLALMTEILNEAGMTDGNRSDFQGSWRALWSQLSRDKRDT